MKLPPEVLGPIVNRIAIAHNLRPDIVMCVILQESGTDTSANRFEPTLYNKLQPLIRRELAGLVPASMPNLATEKVNRACSWGLMQVLGETARWCAKYDRPFLTDLLDPEQGVEVGCRVLSFYLGREGGDYPKALAAYNAGSSHSPAGQAYASQVMERLARQEHVKYLQGK